MATYTWDGRNRLKSVTTTAGQTTNFTYDPFGSLIQQADSRSSLNLTKYFVLDALTNVAFESASDGTSYDVLAGQTIDSHMAIVQSGGQVQYGLTDAINSTVATVDQTGAVKSQFLYEPFGQTTTSASYPFQFTGRMPVSGSLDYYRARFYSAATGRFISEDPIGFRRGVNMYQYARNSPVSLRDPYGRQATSLGYGPPVISGPGTPVNIPYNPSPPSGCVPGQIGGVPVLICPTPPTPPPLTPFQECVLSNCFGQPVCPCMPNGGELQHSDNPPQCLGEPIWIDYGPVPAN